MLNARKWLRPITLLICQTDMIEEWILSYTFQLNLVWFSICIDTVHIAISIFSAMFRSCRCMWENVLWRISYDWNKFFCFPFHFWGSSNSGKCKYLNASMQFLSSCDFAYSTIFIYLMWHVRAQIFTYQNRFIQMGIIQNWPWFCYSNHFTNVNDKCHICCY